MHGGSLNILMCIEFREWLLCSSLSSLGFRSSLHTICEIPFSYPEIGNYKQQEYAYNHS